MGRIDTEQNSGLMVLQQDTTSYGPVLDWTPPDWLHFHGSYQRANRDSPGYNNANIDRHSSDSFRPRISACGPVHR